MRRPLIAGAVWFALALGLWTAFRSAGTATAQPPGNPPPGTPPPGQAQPPGGMPPGQMPPGRRPERPMPAATDSFAAERDSLAKVVLESIAGKENMPAESVFKSIKIMKKVPAGRLLQIMNRGFGRALGARCRLCHVQDHWDAEDREEKKTARLMITMVDTLNTSFMSQIRHRDGSQAFANCGMCHRGHNKPQPF